LEEKGGLWSRKRNGKVLASPRGGRSWGVISKFSELLGGFRRGLEGCKNTKSPQRKKGRTHGCRRSLFPKKKET